MPVVNRSRAFVVARMGALEGAPPLKNVRIKVRYYRIHMPDSHEYKDYGRRLTLRPDVVSMLWNTCLPVCLARDVVTSAS